MGAMQRDESGTRKPGIAAGEVHAMSRAELRGRTPEPAPRDESGSTIKAIADQLTAMDGLDRRDRYVEVLRIAKIVEEAGEAMEALIAYHNVNPRKEAGSFEAVIKELCDVALTAKVAIENFGVDAESAMNVREAEVLDRLRAKAAS